MQNMDANACPFLELPNEILTRVFEELDREDRGNLASIDGRLDGLEKMARRRFKHIKFNKNGFTSLHDVLPSDINFAPVEEVAKFFNHAQIKDLDVDGPLDAEKEHRLTQTIKNINCNSLDICLNENYTARMLRDFINGQTRINILWLSLEVLDEQIEMIEQLILNLPSMQRLLIWFSTQPKLFITEEMLLQLVSRISSVQIECHDIDISAQALLKIFEIFSTSKSNTLARFRAPVKQLQKMFSMLESESEIDTNPTFHTLDHHKSEVRIVWYTDNDSTHSYVNFTI